MNTFLMLSISTEKCLVIRKKVSTFALAVRDVAQSG